ncbi:uncharacterized protein LOC143851144 isoform X2 [Tasmannia lanceolata]|uniref:uncharacterized protein LOC143851144 isoform X2 n=1 Tax=Tasmannia lanceolata TaxID=3420 RepID=UPI004062DA85
MGSCSRDHVCPKPHRLYKFCSFGHPTRLQLSSGQPVESSPGSKPGTLIYCERVHIRGLSRFQHLLKYPNSLKVKVNISEQTSSRVPPRNVEVCLHRNSSLGLGMCPQGNWEKPSKGTWVRSMSPFDSRFLDIRMAGQSFESLEVSTKEEFLLYRVIFLALGVVLMMLASTLSKSLVFYYSSAMAVGIILVILMVLFQGMKLLPTGRKSSLAIFMYSSLIGVGSFLLRYLSGLLRSVLLEIGISEDMYSPVLGSTSSHVTLNCPSYTFFEDPIKVAIFLLIFLALAGAWLGFWGVRKLVLTEDGSVDISIAHFVSWSIWIFAAFMILLSSLDTLLAAEALVCGVILSSIARRIRKSRFLRHMYKQLLRSAKSSHRKSEAFQDPYAEYVNEIQRTESKFLGPRSKHFSLASCISPVPARVSPAGLTKTPTRQLSETYYSSFHDTPERKKFSKEEWETFTRDSTRKALEGLVSSPDFSRWAVANAERITLTPTEESQGKMKGQRRSWLHWF